MRGVVAAETIGRSWFEYGLENVRRQSTLVGELLDQVDADVRAHEKCAYDFYVLREPAEEVVKHGEQCEEMIGSYSSQAEFPRRRQDSKPHPFDNDILEVLINWIEEQLHA